MQRLNIRSNRKLVKPGVFLILTSVVAVSMACSALTEVVGDVQTHEAPGIDVDPVFREYYLHLGGKSFMGLAISDAKVEGSTTVQYLETCKLVFDPNAPAHMRFHLAPLGKEMGIIEPAMPPPVQPGPSYVDGHNIYPEFWPLYDGLGALTVGPPLTELRYNPARKRYEQFFANLGFYRLEGSSEVWLLAYGIWACGEECRSTDLPGNATMDIRWYVDHTFTQLVSDRGADFTGFALGEAYIGRDGKWEQILENVVLVADAPNDPSSVRLRPITPDLSILSEPPEINRNDPNMLFYPTHAEKGYGIPLHFWNYIMAHGGPDTFGPPITHYAPLNNMAYHQCFVNLCLMYDLRGSEGARVRPEPLGYAYKVLYSTQEPEKPSPTRTEWAITMRVWEIYPVVSADQEQEIGLSVTQNNRPVAGMVPILTLTLLDGSEKLHVMPPTDTNGLSRLRLAPIPAPNGTLIMYKVCVPRSENETFCVADSFVIWNNNP